MANPRTSSAATQFIFELLLRSYSARGRFRLLRCLIRDALQGLYLRCRGHAWVTATVYGHTLRFPCEHDLPLTLQCHPQYNQGLALAVGALVQDTMLAVIDAGANVGETVAIIEQHFPGRCSFLCVDASSELAEVCRQNYAASPRVQVIQAFIGDSAGAVELRDDGRANGSAVASGSGTRPERLDVLAQSFAEAQGLALLKTDLEGYDFKALRSAAKLLQTHHPAVYFEWYPALLRAAGEDPLAGFHFLAALGYSEFVFFTASGGYYTAASSPSNALLHSLIGVAESNAAVLYFDVFGSTSAHVAGRLLQAVSTRLVEAVQCDRGPGDEVSSADFDGDAGDGRRATPGSPAASIPESA